MIDEDDLEASEKGLLVDYYGDRILKNLWGITFVEAGQVASFDNVDRFKFRDFEEIKAIGMQLGEDRNRDELTESRSKPRDK